MYELEYLDIEENKKYEETIKKVLEQCFKQEKLENSKLYVSITLTNPENIHKINKEYRNKDYPADIITFAIFADSEDKFIFDGEINLGEVIIALDKVIEEASKKNVTKEFELAFLISHGILHLLGFDHQTEEDYNFVIDLQNKALESIGYDKV